MNKITQFGAFSFSVLLLLVIMPFGPAGAQALIADHEAYWEFESIPSSVIEEVSANFHMFYRHTSHGSQPLQGMSMLLSENSLYQYFTIYEQGADLGANGDTSWAAPIRDYLSANPDCNVATVAWCGGHSWTDSTEMLRLFTAFENLQDDFPDVTFIYQTGHLESIADPVLHGWTVRSNNQIRDYCVANGKVLFDFADIESWDPDGNYYSEDDDACNWCYTYCAQNDCPDCVTGGPWMFGGDNCAHSHCFNCYQKGRAWWWLMARISGWEGSTDIQPEETMPLSYVFDQNQPNPFNNSTILRYNLPTTANVSLDIFDTLGRYITTLVNGKQPAGQHDVVWDASNYSSGVYFAHLKAEDYSHKIKMVLLK